MKRWRQLDAGVLSDGKRFLIYPVRKRFLVLDLHGNAKDGTMYPCEGTLIECKRKIARIELKETRWK